MGYAIAGWVEFVVELQWVSDESADMEGFMQSLAKPPLSMSCTILPTGAGAQSLGAMVEGQTTSSQFIRVACPASMVHVAMSVLNEAAGQAFPRQH